MADIQGPKGKPAPEGTDQGDAGGLLPQGQIVAQIELLPMGNFAIKTLVPIAIPELCSVMAQLISALIDKSRKEKRIITL